MEQKDFDALMGKINTEVKDVVQTEVEAAVNGLMTPDIFGAKMEALGLKENAFADLKEAVEKQGIQMKQLFEKKENKKELGELLQEKAADLKDLATGTKSRLKLNLKTDVTRASVTNHTLAMRLPDVGQLAYQATVIPSLFRQAQVSPNSNGVIRYVDQLAATRNADSVAEAAVKPESALTWQEYTLNVEKIADTIPVTMEAFNDVNFIESEIRRLLEVNIAIKRDNLFWNGDGISPNIKGVYTSAPEYVAAASGITGANIYDLIIKMSESITTGRRGKGYRPNYALMNAVDINKLRLTKDSQNNYIIPPFASQDGMQVAGIQIIESNSVTANTMLVGDFNYGTRYVLDSLMLDMGWIDKQFVENMMTLRAEVREALLVRTVDANAFAKETDIAAALVTLAS